MSIRWVLSAVLLLRIASVAGFSPPPPADLSRRAGVEQRLGAAVPMNLEFRDARGLKVTLAEIAHGRPVLLALGYYRCPNLCDMVLHGMALAAASVPLRPAEDYEVVFVSIDPRENSADASQAQRSLAHQQTLAHVERWHLLTGDGPSVRALSAAAGFSYFFDPRNQQYAHAAGAVILTGEGRIAQYFFGVQFPPDALRLALIGASRGQLGSLIDRLVLLCCGYDPSTGRYSMLIGRATRVTGIGFLLLAGLMMVRMQRRPQA
jgi:protein SCO1/2